MEILIDEIEILNEFIKIGIDTFEDAEKIFKLATRYFQEIKNNEYDIENTTLVEGLINKMVSISENFDLNPNIISELNSASNQFISVIGNRGQNKETIIKSFNKIVSVSMKFYNAMVREKPKTNSAFGPFQPDKSDKTIIILKISEAIEIIEKSELFTDKIKSKLTEMLNSVISELNKPKTNWNVYFKNINYIIMFLGSIGSIASGFAGYQQIIATQQKLKEANAEIEKSSINISKKDIKEVFVIDETMRIDAKETLKIEKKNK